MTDNPKGVTEDNVFLNFVREMRADLNSDSFNSMADRLVAEKKAMAILTNLRNEGFVVQETIDETAGYDCIIRRFTEEFLVIFKYDKTYSNPSIEDFARLSNILKLNSVSRGVIVTWLLIENFPSLAFTNPEINKIVKNQPCKFDFRQQVKPLSDCIAEIFNIPTGLVHDLKGFQASELPGDKTEVKNIFNNYLNKSFNDLKAKEFKLDYKKKALEQFSSEDLNEIQEFSYSAIEEPFPKKKLEDYLQKITGTSEK